MVLLGGHGKVLWNQATAGTIPKVLALDRHTKKWNSRQCQSLWENYLIVSSL